MQRRSTIKANPKGSRFTYKKNLVGHDAGPSVTTGHQRHILYERTKEGRMIKYAICPGYVISKTDGDRHFISAPQLMRLYGVAPHECIVVHNWPEDYAGRREAYDKLIVLSPRSDGNYRETRGLIEQKRRKK